MFTVMFTVIWNLLILRICQSSVCKDLDVFDTTSPMICSNVSCRLGWFTVVSGRVVPSLVVSDRVASLHLLLNNPHRKMLLKCVFAFLYFDVVNTGNSEDIQELAGRLAISENAH